MSDDVVVIPPRWAAALTVLRHVAGWVVGSALAAFAWLIVVQEGVERGWTTVDFVRSFGELLGAGAEEASHRGWYATIVSWSLIALVVLPLARVIPVRGLLAGVVLAVIPFLLWGVLFMSLVGDRLPGQTAGLFGGDDGWEPFVLYAGGAVVATVVLVRVYQLMSGRRWWEPKRHSLEESLAALSVAPPSLELPEQRREQGGERPGT